ncbi:MAG: cell division protein FtsL [Acidobacteria bacterium]|nr:cell division protein FtsL [Acidobacteriota bacterium]MBE3130741.1 cell division protein FtsL [Acidobacteriota bacterium]
MVRRKWSPRGIALGAALLVTVVGILTFYVWYQTESVKLGIDLGKSEDKIRELEQAIETLKLRKAALLDPARVEKIARESLGLVDPKGDEVIYEKRDTSR